MNAKPDTNKDKPIGGRLEKISVNLGIGKLSADSNFSDKALEGVMKDFALITGQKPQTRPAKKSIAGFKLREGTVVGLRATLRGARMMEFLDRLIKVVIPRIRDFRGIDKKSVDSNGNLTIGIKENYVFPEINPEVSKINFGLEITVVPESVKNREAAIKLYESLGILFKKTEK